ncbi:MAG: phosphatidylserine decarboxylase [Sulfurimonas sp.]|nr:phosphatidylserine decarboxylase [Sulfurimonas sp.]
MKNNLLPIAKEGWNYVIGSVVAFLVFTLFNFDFLEFFSFLAILFFLFVFRNPEREHLLYQEESVVAPVDGTVSSIEEILEDGYLGYRVVVEGSHLNVGLLRAPFNATIEDVTSKKGARLSGLSPLSEALNEQAELIFSDKKSLNKLKIIHTLKQSFAPINIDAIANQTMMQGARYGFMVNGTTTLCLPKNFRLNVSIGSELIASETLIGYFTSEPKK